VNVDERLVWWQVICVAILLPMFLIIAYSYTGNILSLQAPSFSLNLLEDEEGEGWVGAPIVFGVCYMIATILFLRMAFKYFR
jgi:hypothetical protein